MFELSNRLICRAQATIDQRPGDTARHKARVCLHCPVDLRPTGEHERDELGEGFLLGSRQLRDLTVDHEQRESGGSAAATNGRIRIIKVWPMSISDSTETRRQGIRQLMQVCRRSTG